MTVFYCVQFPQIWIWVCKRNVTENGLDIATLNQVEYKILKLHFQNPCQLKNLREEETKKILK